MFYKNFSTLQSSFSVFLFLLADLNGKIITQGPPSIIGKMSSGMTMSWSNFSDSSKAALALRAPSRSTYVHFVERLSHQFILRCAWDFRSTNLRSKEKQIFDEKEFVLFLYKNKAGMRPPRRKSVLFDVTLTSKKAN